MEREKDLLPSPSFMYETQMLSPRIEPFEAHTIEYEKWFDNHAKVYESELQAIRRVLPKFDRGLEIGVGTGRFSQPFGIQNGVEPARNALKLAASSGIEVVDGVGEALPYRSESFDLALIVTSICFFSNVSLSLRESYRILKHGGSLVIGFVDKDSELGKMYQERSEESPFYSSANFYGASELKELVLRVGFVDLVPVQTVFKSLNEINAVEPVKQGYGEGSFVVLRSRKPSS